MVVKDGDSLWIGKSEPKYIDSQMVVKDGDESHGTIRKRITKKNKQT